MKYTWPQNPPKSLNFFFYLDWARAEFNYCFTSPQWHPWGWLRHRVVSDSGDWRRRGQWHRGLVCYPRKVRVLFFCWLELGLNINILLLIEINCKFQSQYRKIMDWFMCYWIHYYLVFCIIEIYRKITQYISLIYFIKF